MTGAARRDRRGRVRLAGPAHHRDRHRRARRVPRLPAHLEGPEHAAHAAHVGHERDPRHRAARRPAGHRAGRGALEDIILVIAIAFGTINIVGGFLVTDRMLEMFKRKDPPQGADA
jgi:hypothetical protein